jgi:hypothetical protein
MAFGRSFAGFFLAAVAMATTAWAQEYKTDAPDTEARKHSAIVNQCIRSPGTFAQNRAQVEEFFTKFYFPSMTGTTPEELSKLGLARYNLFNNYLWATTDPQFQRGLTDIIYAAMGNIVKPQQPPYHPAVRFNAILTIGMLDEQYAQAGASPQPPKPLARATKALTGVVDSATTKNLFAPPVIVGAVIGLERHAQLRDQLDPASIQPMTAALLKLVVHEQPIQDMDRNAFAWLRLRAASALATLGGVGQNNEVHDGLVKLVGSLRSLDDRCAAAALLAKIKYEGAKVDGAATANGLFALARDIAAAESKRAKELQDAAIGVGGGVGGMQAIDPVTGAPAERFPRRQLLDRLLDLRAALQAIKPVVADDAKVQVDAVLAAIAPVITSAADKSTVELKLTQDIVAMAEAINRAVPAPQAPAPAAAEEDEF